MSEITRTSFVYSPIRQGYDTNSWRTISGAPAVVSGSGRIAIDQVAGIASSAIHYADFLKGDISFDVNIPATPVAGDDRLFGVSAPNTSAYILFSIDENLTCMTSDGTTSTESASITWDSNWTGVDTEFRIRWEAGTAKFFINGSQVYAVSDASVPMGVLSLYISDNSASAMTFGDMNVRGTQSYVKHVATSDSTATTSGAGTLTKFESVVTAENVSILLPSLDPLFSESVTVTENASQYITELFLSPSDLVAITENIVLPITILFFSPFEEITVTENIEIPG